MIEIESCPVFAETLSSITICTSLVREVHWTI